MCRAHIHTAKWKVDSWLNKVGKRACRRLIIDCFFFTRRQSNPSSYCLISWPGGLIEPQRGEREAMCMYIYTDGKNVSKGQLNKLRSASWFSRPGTKFVQCHFADCWLRILLTLTNSNSMQPIRTSHCQLAGPYRSVRFLHRVGNYILGSEHCPNRIGLAMTELHWGRLETGIRVSMTLFKVEQP